MNCEKISNALIAYLDGRASGQERREVEAHLKLCAVCQERAEEFRRLWHVMEEAPAVEPTLGFDARLGQRLAAEPQRKTWSWLVPAPRLSFAVALLAILTVWVAARQPVVEPNGGSEAQFRMIKDLGVLENYDVLSNFDVLSDLPAVQEISNQPNDESQPQSQDEDSDSGRDMGQS
jgi:predicted anti-sigma-YlaC factor YlaD